MTDWTDVPFNSQYSRAWTKWGWKGWVFCGGTEWGWKLHDRITKQIYKLTLNKYVIFHFYHNVHLLLEKMLCAMYMESWKCLHYFLPCLVLWQQCFIICPLISPAIVVIFLQILVYMDGNVYMQINSTFTQGWFLWLLFYTVIFLNVCLRLACFCFISRAHDVTFVAVLLH